MNNIYVDKLPKSCNECKLGYFYDCQYCFLRPNLAEKQEWCEKEKHCPLKLLSDHSAEVRKKVVQEIRTELANKLTYNINDLENIMVICNKINSVLDKFEGETK